MLVHQGNERPTLMTTATNLKLGRVVSLKKSGLLVKSSMVTTRDLDQGFARQPCPWLIGVVIEW